MNPQMIGHVVMQEKSLGVSFFGLISKVLS